MRKVMRHRAVLVKRAACCNLDTMMRFLIPITLAATSVAADVIGPGGKTVDCYCTDSRGARVEIGETICLQVDGRMFMAQCQMSLNVPIWREVSAGCLNSELREPAFDAGAVDAHVTASES